MWVFFPPSFSLLLLQGKNSPGKAFMLPAIVLRLRKKIQAA
jgi:hypothetical protein